MIDSNLIQLPHLQLPQQMGSSKTNYFNGAGQGSQGFFNIVNKTSASIKDDSLSMVRDLNFKKDRDWSAQRNKGRTKKTKKIEGTKKRPFR